MSTQLVTMGSRYLHERPIDLLSVVGHVLEGRSQVLIDDLRISCVKVLI